MKQWIIILWAYFKIGLAKHFYYRGTVLISVLSKLISLGFLIFLWSKIFQSEGEVGGKTLSQIIVYYLFAYIARTITSPNVATIIGERIRDGVLQMYILRPGHVLFSFFSMPLSKRLYELLVLLSLALFAQILIFPSLGLSIGNLHYPAFILLLILGMLINFFAASIIAASAFWILDSGPILYSYSSVTGILSGLLVPISFFPSWARKTIEFLPFRFTISDPVLALQGEIAGMKLLTSVVLAIFWVFALGMINSLLWRKGTKRFDAVGN